MFPGAPAPPPAAGWPASKQNQPYIIMVYVPMPNKGLQGNKNLSSSSPLLTSTNSKLLGTNKLLMTAFPSDFTWDKNNASTLMMYISVDKDNIFQYLYGKSTSFYLINTSTKKEIYTGVVILIAFFTPEDFNETFKDGISIQFTLNSKDYQVGTYQLKISTKGEDKLNKTNFELSAMTNVRMKYR